MAMVAIKCPRAQHENAETKIRLEITASIRPNKLAQFYSGQIQPNGALSLRRSVQLWSGVDKAEIEVA